MTTSPPRGTHTVRTWAVRCDSHSEPDGGIHVIACGVPRQCASVCPCVIADRYVVVEAVRADRQWWHCADVLICPPQPCRSAALLATEATLARLPGCTFAVAPFGASACVVRGRMGTVLVSPYPAGPALLATYVHRAM